MPIHTVKAKPFIQEEDEKPVVLNAGGLQEAISALEDAEPDKRKREHKTWVKLINKLMKEYNDRFDKTFNLIK